MICSKMGLMSIIDDRVQRLKGRDINFNLKSAFDTCSSLRISVLRFPLIVCVVFIHSYSSTVGLSGGVIGGGVSQNSIIYDFVKDIISEGIARIAVPLFFLLSGYLFFIGFKWSKENYLIKLKARINTLLIPFLFWNITTLILLILAQTIPATQIFFSGENPLLVTYNSFDYLNAIIGLNRYPIAYQFWFIRDLMILTLLVPLINVINRVRPYIFLSIVLICWLIGVWPIYAPSSVSLLFFSVGAYWASIGKSLFAFDKLGFKLLTFYFSIVVVDVLTIGDSFNACFHKITIMFGVLAALFLSKLVIDIPRLKSLMLRLSGASFFVFAIHEPLLTILKKMAYQILLPQKSSIIFFLYFFIPIITILTSLLIYRCFSFLMPNFTRIVTGGRIFNVSDESVKDTLRFTL